jgi:hypothetical protein
LDILKLASAFEKLALAVQWWNEPVPAQPKGAALSSSFWIKFVQMCQRLGVSPYDLAAVINKESAFDPTARNFAAGKNRGPVAQGLSQFIRYTASGLGVKKSLWEKFAHLPAEEQLKWVEKYFKRGRAKGKSAGQLYLMNFGGFNNPDGSLYAGHDAQQAWIARHPEDQGKFKRANYQQKAIEQNPGLVSNDRIMASSITRLVSGGIQGPIRGKIDEAVRAVGSSQPPAFQEPSPEWTGQVSQTPQYEAPIMGTPQMMQGTFESPLLQESDTLLKKLWQ